MGAKMRATLVALVALMLALGGLAGFDVDGAAACAATAVHGMDSETEVIE